MRDDLGLEAGAILRIEKVEGKIILHAVHGEPRIKEKKGILVFTGKAIGDVEAALHEHRKKRLKKVSSGI